MSLDLFQTVPQIEAMAADLKVEHSRHRERLRYALQLLGSPRDVEALRRKVETARTTWLVAGLDGAPGAKAALPPSPAECYVLATDGSHIDVDRHRAAGCYLINIGTVSLRYGSRPVAALRNSPRLYSKEEDMVLSTAATGGRDEPLRGELLGIRRYAEECRALCDLVRRREDLSPTLAVLDGSLVLWGLAGGAYQEAVVEWLLQTGLLSCLEELRGVAGQGPLVAASYVSFPGNTEVVNVLRVAICPHEMVDCDRFCPKDRKDKECDRLSGLLDRDLFADALEPGERSAVFYSRSSVVRRYYGRHEVCFFYLNVGDEIARVEVPRWVVSAGVTDLAHALIHDQCRRGNGYPAALSEAHEQAVVTGADREMFWQVVEEALQREGLGPRGSLKSASKRTRWI